MKSGKVAIIILAAALCSTGTAFCAESENAERHPWMGVLLDTTPLPDLLVKHLGLAPGQGIRIGNVHRGSPADKAGLERDDIIIGFQGKDVTDYDTFVDEVRKTAVGTEVSLTIIHLGQRQTVKLKLEPFTGNVDLKYPREPQMVESWRPGKIFRFTPGDKEWTEILRDNMPKDFDANIRRFFDEVHSYHHSNGEEYTVTVQGDPNDEDAVIIVHAGDAEYKTTAKHIDKLPEKYREPAEHALKDAKEASAKAEAERRPRRVPSNWRPFLDRLRPGTNPPADRFGPNDQTFDKMQKQMRELQQRLDKLEKQQKETLNSRKPSGQT